jgi:hypothetical protein
MRMPRIKAIQWRSQKMGNTKKKMGIVQEMLLYLILWIFGKGPLSFIASRSCCTADRRTWSIPTDLFLSHFKECLVASTATTTSWSITMYRPR